ncbi:hypothetical protein K488DRAFT_15958, partial [Vararia minispora EC-137]
LYHRHRRQQFLQGLATVHAGRGNPLPPALTGVNLQGYDPLTSQWNVLELTPDPGYIRFAAKDIDLFRLFQVVTAAGGSRKITDEHRWADLFTMFEIAPEMAKVLASYYLNILSPLEDAIMRRQQQQQQQQQHQQQQIHLPGVPPQPSQPSGSRTQFDNAAPPVQQHQPPPQAQPPPPQPLQPPQLVSGPIHAPPQVARSASSGSLALPSTEHASDPVMDPEAETRKRKLAIDEDAKRSRQKTGTSDPSAPPAPPSAPASASTSTMPSPSSTQGPRRRRVEYRPLLREIDTDAGRDLQAIQAEQRRYMAGAGGCRSLDDWGALEIDALTMSLRSRIALELSYALTTLTILSIMRNGPSGFPIHQCPDLLDELLDLAEETAFGDAPDTRDEPLPDEIVTQKELVQAILDDANALFSSDPPQGRKPPQAGPFQRPADILLCITNILRNLSLVPDNRDVLARHERLMPVCMRLCGVRRDAPALLLRAACPAFSLTDLVSARRDVLYLLVNLGHAVLLAPNLTQPATPSATRTAQRVFDLVAAYLLEPGPLSPYTLMLSSGARTPPPLPDAALEVLTRFALPDQNRKTLARAVPISHQRALFANLVHRLPLSDADFHVLREEAWLAHVERAIMALFALAFLAPPALKRAYRADTTLGVPRLLLRLVKRFTVGVSQQFRVFYSVCARRVVETLKVLDDAADAFEIAQATGPALAFGMGYGDAEEAEGDKGDGLLAGFQEDVLWGVMMQKEVSQDEFMFHELESLARVG